MPSDDLILSLKQIAGYPTQFDMDGTESILVQVGGLGGPYYSTSAANFVGTSLATAGNMEIAGTLNVTGLAGFENAQVYTNLIVDGLLTANGLQVNGASTFGGVLTGSEIVADVSVTCGGIVQAANMICDESINVGGLVHAANVQVDGVLTVANLLVHGSPVATMDWAAPIFSPSFFGNPTAPTPSLGSNNTSIATTAFVTATTVLYINNLLQTQPFVFTFNGRSGEVVLTPEDLTGAEVALLDSPALTGTPTAPTPPTPTNNTQLATTAFVYNAVAAYAGPLLAPLISPAFSGVPTAPTAPPGSNSGQLATTAFVTAAVTASTSGVASFNTRTGAVELDETDLTAAGGALNDSPIFTGTPQAPTAPVGTNSTQIATCAWVLSEIGGSTVGVMSFNGRGGVVSLLPADITGASGALLAGPAFTGTPTAPTATAGTSTQQLATTAFVANAITAGAVASFNGRTGAVNLIGNDVSAAGGALLAGPTFTGIPSGPTAAPGNSTTQLATTAFVAAAIGSLVGVTSFNTRSGAVTLTTADVTAAGGAPIAAPAFTGAPSAPTPALANSSAQLATTAFVRTGVTDGSNPAPGQIGEWVSVWNPAPGATPGAPGALVNAAQVGLQPGDWDVEGIVGVSSTGTLTAFQGGLSTSNSSTVWPTANGFPYVQHYPGSALGGQVFTTGRGRLNVAAGTTVFLMCSVQYSGSPTPTIYGGIFARRMR